MTSSVATTTISGHVLDREGKPLKEIRLVVAGEEEVRGARAASTGAPEVSGGRVHAGSAISVHEEQEDMGRVGRTYKAKTNRKGAFVMMVDSGTYSIDIEDEILALDALTVHIEDEEHKPVLDWEGRIAPNQPLPRINVGPSETVTIEISVAPKDEIAKEYSSALLGAIAVALEQGDKDKAMKTVENLLATSPDDPVGLTLRAYILTEEGRYEEAESDLNEALEGEPGLYDALYQLAVLYRETGREKEAFGLFQTAVEKAQDGEQKAKALLNIGELERDNHRTERAIEAFEAAVSEMPAIKPQVAPELAALYTALGDTAKAEQWLQDETSDGPVDPTLHYNIAVSHFNRREWEKAAEAFTKVIEADPDFAEAYRNLGYTLLNLGDRGAALESFRKFLELKPEGAEADEVRPLVDALSQAAQ